MRHRRSNTVHVPDFTLDHLLPNQQQEASRSQNASPNTSPLLQSQKPPYNHFTSVLSPKRRPSPKKDSPNLTYLTVHIKNDTFMATLSHPVWWMDGSFSTLPNKITCKSSSTINIHQINNSPLIGLLSFTITLDPRYHSFYHHPQHKTPSFSPWNNPSGFNPELLKYLQTPQSYPSWMIGPGGLPFLPPSVEKLYDLQQEFAEKYATKIMDLERKEELENKDNKSKRKSPSLKNKRSSFLQRKKRRNSLKHNKPTKLSEYKKKSKNRKSRKSSPTDRNKRRRNKKSNRSRSNSRVNTPKSKNKNKSNAKLTRNKSNKLISKNSKSKLSELNESNNKSKKSNQESKTNETIKSQNEKEEKEAKNTKDETNIKDTNEKPKEETPSPKEESKAPDLLVASPLTVSNLESNDSQIKSNSEDDDVGSVKIHDSEDTDEDNMGDTLQVKQNSEGDSTQDDDSDGSQKGNNKKNNVKNNNDNNNIKKSPKNKYEKLKLKNDISTPISLVSNDDEDDVNNKFDIVVSKMNNSDSDGSNENENNNNKNKLDNKIDDNKEIESDEEFDIDVESPPRYRLIVLWSLHDTSNNKKTRKKFSHNRHYNPNKYNVYLFEDDVENKLILDHDFFLQLEEEALVASMQQCVVEHELFEISATLGGNKFTSEFILRIDLDDAIGDWPAPQGSIESNYFLPQFGTNPVMDMMMNFQSLNNITNVNVLNRYQMMQMQLLNNFVNKPDLSPRSSRPNPSITRVRSEDVGAKDDKNSRPNLLKNRSRRYTDNFVDHTRIGGSRLRLPKKGHSRVLTLSDILDESNDGNSDDDDDDNQSRLTKSRNSRRNLFKKKANKRQESNQLQKMSQLIEQATTTRRKKSLLPPSNHTLQTSNVSTISDLSAVDSNQNEDFQLQVPTVISNNNSNVSTNSTENLPMVNIPSSSKPNQPTLSQSVTNLVEQPKVRTPTFNTNLVVKVGDFVLVDNSKKGKVMWMGESARLGEGIVYGILLVEAEGDCDGTYMGTRVFQCPQDHGIIVPKRRITSMLNEQLDFSIIEQKQKEINETRHNALQAIYSTWATSTKFRTQSIPFKSFSLLLMIADVDDEEGRLIFDSASNNGDTLTLSEYEIYMKKENEKMGYFEPSQSEPPPEAYQQQQLSQNHRSHHQPKQPNGKFLSRSLTERSLNLTGMNIQQPKRVVSRVKPKAPRRRQQSHVSFDERGYDSERHVKPTPPRKDKKRSNSIRHPPKVVVGTGGAPRTVVVRKKLMNIEDHPGMVHIREAMEFQEEENYKDAVKKYTLGIALLESGLNNIDRGLAKRKWKKIIEQFRHRQSRCTFKLRTMKRDQEIQEREAIRRKLAKEKALEEQKKIEQRLQAKQTEIEQELEKFEKKMKVDEDKVHDSDPEKSYAQQWEEQQKEREEEQKLRKQKEEENKSNNDEKDNNTKLNDDEFSIRDPLSKDYKEPSKKPMFSGRKRKGVDKYKFKRMQKQANRGEFPSHNSDDEHDDSRKKKSKMSKHDKELHARIAGDVISEAPNVSFSDVIGLEQVKLALYENIILPQQRPDLFGSVRKPCTGLLLFGPPGNGKTMIAKCVATEIKCTFFSISASSITSKFVGEAERIMRTLFQMARRRQPSIIFIDEIDSLLTARGGKNEAESSRRIKTEFLIQFDGVHSSKDDEASVTVIGATNLPNQLDDAVLRRFPKRILVPNPNKDARYGLLRLLTRKQDHDLTEANFQHLANNTQNYSCSDIAQMCNDAFMGPLREAMKITDLSTAKASSIPKLGFRHFKQSMGNIRASVPPESLKLFLNWDKNYGSKLFLTMDMLPESMKSHKLPSVKQEREEFKKKKEEEERKKREEEEEENLRELEYELVEHERQNSDNVSTSNNRFRNDNSNNKFNSNNTTNNSNNNNRTNSSSVTNNSNNVSNHRSTISQSSNNSNDLNDDNKKKTSSRPRLPKPRTTHSRKNRNDDSPKPRTKRKSKDGVKSSRRRTSQTTQQLQPTLNNARSKRSNRSNRN